ncbi:1200_t:CDS:2, partial [Ambispora leptoticha]
EEFGVQAHENDDKHRKSIIKRLSENASNKQPFYTKLTFYLSSFQDSSLCHKTFQLIRVAYYTTNRWLAFLAHLSMMFFIWNSLLMVIGCVSTVQMAIGFGFEVMKITNPRSDNQTAQIAEEPRSPINEFIRNRRKGYQEMVDGLYVKYMNRLVGVQQEQAAYVQQQHHHNYYHPQPQYMYAQHTQQQKYYYPPTGNNQASSSSIEG